MKIQLAIAAAAALLAGARPAAAQACDASATTTTYAPAKNVFGELLFEDQWPVNGDLDFNDQVFAYNFVFNQTALGKVTSLQVNIDVMAVGAWTDNALYLHLPVAAGSTSSILLNGVDGVQHALTPLAGETDLIVELSANTRTLFGAPVNTFINTDATLTPSPAVALNLVIQFTTPLVLAPAGAPYDLFIERVLEAGHQIHRPMYAGTTTMNTALFGTGDDGSTATTHFINQSGLPFALTIPQVVAWPKEKEQIDSVYPDIDTFASSGGTLNTSWYTTTVVTDLTWQGLIAASQPAPVVLGPALGRACAVTAPAVCHTGNDPETNSPYVVCRADANTAWLSANNAGSYHVTQICQLLGYTSMIHYGGTCGEVCGYCQAPTSCNAPGREEYDGNGNCGFDADGQIICITVEWECSH